MSLSKKSSSSSRKLFLYLFVEPLSKQKKALFVVLLSLGFLSLAQTLFIILIGPLFSVMFLEEASETVNLAKILPSRMIEYVPIEWQVQLDTSSVIFALPFALCITVLIKGLAQYFFQVNQNRVALWVAKVYRDRLFERLLDTSYLEQTKKSPAEWMAVLMNDVLLLQTRYSDFAAILVKDSVLVAAALLAVFLIHWPMALSLVLAAPVLILVLGRLGDRISYYAQGWQENLRQMASQILDFRQRFSYIAAQQGIQYEQNRFEILNRNYLNMIKKSLRLRSSFAPGLEFFGFLCFALVIYAINQRTFGFGAEFGADTLMQFLAAVGVLLKPLKSVGEQLSRLAETKGVLGEGYRLFESLTENSKPSKLGKCDAEKKYTKLTSPFDIKILLIEVAYSKESTLPALVARDLCIESGKSIAIVGPSGAGKSSLLKCLVGLIPPVSWRSDISYRAFAESTGFVSQTPFFFNDSLLRNLLYGTEDNREQRQRLDKLLAIFELDGLVADLEKGLETIVSSVQSNFSGGQLQRLTILRALLQDKPILCLDEATSAIEDRLEKKLTAFLIDDASKQGRALIAVTHRLQTLSSFDLVYFVENAKLQLIGPHSELLKDERYLSFVQTES